MPGLRYSDRRRLAETGSLGDLEHQLVPAELATAMQVIVEGAFPPVSARFEKLLENELVQHFGRTAQWWVFYVASESIDAFLDAVEILAEQASTSVALDGFQRSRVPIPEIEERINRAFERFRFGYRIEDGEIRKIGSPALEEAIVGPALLAVQREGWEEAERSFREALAHQRGGETDDALTAANAAVEAALKAIGLKGGTLKELARAFKNSGLVPGYLSNVPELLEDLLDRLHAARSVAGDAHGKPPGASEVPPELADLAIYWAGTFIAYLADATRAPS